MKLVNLIPLKEIDFRNQDAFDDYNKKHKLRPDTKVTIDGKPTTAGQAAKNSEPVKGSSVFGKDSGGSVFGKTGGASAKSDKTASASKESTIDVESLTSYKDFNKFFKANKDKLDAKYANYIEDEIGALKYLESDYKRGDADRDEVDTAYLDLQDLIKNALPKDAIKAAEPKAQLPKKASELDYTHAETLEKVVNSEAGLTGYVDTDENTDAIMYNASKGMSPTYTLYFGGNSDYNRPDEFRVSLLPTYGNDPSNIGNKVDKTFVTGDAAMKFMVDVAKKYKKELEMDDDDMKESTKLSSILPKKYTK